MQRHHLIWRLRLNGSYITFVEEEEFLKYPKMYIDNAYEKSENDGKGYDLRVME